MADIGLLASLYADGIQLKILDNEPSINFGSVYENAVAQELWAHGFQLYYYNNKRQGELDFVIEQNGEVLPLEVKSFSCDIGIIPDSMKRTLGMEWNYPQVFRLWVVEYYHSF